MLRARTNPDRVSQRAVNAGNSLKSFHLPGSVDRPGGFKDMSDAAVSD